MQDKDLYEFGDYTLNVEEQSLSKFGEAISITPKVFSLLKMLIENHGKVVTKDELMETVWEGNLVEDSNLTFTVRQLRKALGDDFRNPIFIETIPRRGYRFIGEVKNVSKKSVDEQDDAELEESLDDLSSKIIPEKKRVFSRSWLFGGMVFAILISAIVIGSAYQNNNAISPIFSKSYTAKSLAVTGNSTYSAISPNGKYVAYINVNDGKESVWIKNLETDNNIEIVPPAEVIYLGLVFSRNNEYIFLSKNERNKSEQLNLYKVSILGGMQEKILEEIQGFVSVSPNDKQLSFVRYAHKPDDYCSLWIADIDGTNQKKIVIRLDDIDIGDNEWTNDGKKIIFANGHSENASQFYSVSEVEVETGNEKYIFQSKFFNIKNLQILRDEFRFLLTGNLKMDEPSRIWSVSKTNGELTALTNSDVSYKTLSLNEDEDKLVTTTIEKDFKIYTYQSENLADFKVLNDAFSIDYTPNGDQIFSSSANGNNDIWSLDKKTGQRKQLTNDKARDFVPKVTSDGKYIFFSSNRTGNEEVWRMDADGNNQIQITKEEGGYPVGADGNYLYYRSALKKNLWKVPIGGGQEELLIDKRSYNFSLSNDKTRIAYFDKKEGKASISIFSLSENRVVDVVSIESKSRSLELEWVEEDRSIAYILFDSKGNFELRIQDLDKKTPPKITDLGKEEINTDGGFSYSPDGKEFSLIRGGYKNNVYLIEGLK